MAIFQKLTYDFYQEKENLICEQVNGDHDPGIFQKKAVKTFKFCSFKVYP